MARELAPNMLQCVGLNLSRKNNNLRLFEIGKAYFADSLPLTTLPTEEQRVSICATEVTFEQFRDDVLQTIYAFTNSGVSLVRGESNCLHPGICANVVIDGEVCGQFGKLHPQIANNFGIEVDCYYAELCVDKLLAHKRGAIKFSPISKFPSVTRDFAFVCDEDVAVQGILNEFLCLPLVESATLFDVYRGEQLGKDKKSIAISVVFTDATKTLQDKEIEKQSGKALRSIQEKYGAVLR